MEIFHTSQSKTVLNYLVATLSTSTLYTLGAYSFASVIFSGPLSPYLIYGFNIMLISNLLSCLFGSRFSSFPALASLTQTSALAIFALISAALVANMRAMSSHEEPIYTVYAAMILLTLLAGLFLWALGKFKMGNIVRFIPLPVVAAFFAASGWILIDFSIRLVVGKHINELQWQLPNTQALFQLSLSFGIVMTIFALQTWFQRSRVEPLVYVVSLLLFYGSLFITETSMEQLRTSGWYIHVARLGELSNSLHTFSLAKIQWSAFLDWHIMGNVLAILAITPLFILLTLNGIERETPHEFNYNHELKHTGLLNIILSALGVGTIVGPVLSATLRNYQLGAQSHFVGILTAALFLIALIFGATVLESIPLFIVASLPLTTGITFLKKWLFSMRHTLSRQDGILLWSVFLVIVFYGFLAGIFFGFLAALWLFDYRYSRMTVVRNTVTGLQLHSNNERGLAAESLLRNSREGIEVMILQGYLFFGNIHLLIEQLIEKIERPDNSKPNFIILDYRNVQGMDPSATESFFRLYRHAHARDMRVVFTQLPDVLFQDILNFLKLPANNDFFFNFPNLDHGLEWCENYFLKQKTKNWQTYFAGQLYLVFPDELELQSFIRYLEPLKVPIGTVIFSETDTLNQIYFLDTGILDMIHTDAEGRATRVKTVYPGVFFGETGLYLGTTQLFSCVAKSDCSLYRLSFEQLINMENKDPKLALVFHRHMVCQTLSRLTHSNKTLLSLV